jgi:hypothetical protein
MQFDIFKILFIFIKDWNCKDMFMFLATYIIVGDFKLKM